MLDEIIESKKKFNQFFQKDLYGKFNNDDNIILSRGGWEDNFISFPKLFSYCVNYTFRKHWTGYSDSLGHKNTIQALRNLVNIKQIVPQYNVKNIAITMGNVLTIGCVFRELNRIIPNSDVLTFKPYYPPILKSINYFFKSIYFLSSLDSEKLLILNIKNTIKNNNNVKILFFSNSIGVEGRIFSENFWKKILDIIKVKKIYLIIDEGLWFAQLPYPPNINNKWVIRVISLSKKYGLPGCKFGFMLAGDDFIEKFYDCASTNYGGPLSVFFLLGEFIYQFEYIYYSGIKFEDGCELLSKQYKISVVKLKVLYEDFVLTIYKNQKKLLSNQKIFSEWVKNNLNKIDKFYNFGGLNVFIKPKINITAYDFFLTTIRNKKLSIMPSLCLGDEKDSMFRITLLESRKKIKIGLNRLATMMNYFLLNK